MQHVRTFIAALALCSSAASADDQVTKVEHDDVLGVGYKVGNGIGFLGADVVVNPLPHLSLDLQGSYVAVATSSGPNATGYALAPAIQGHLYDGRRSTPYAGIGVQYVTVTDGTAHASGDGVFANLGYEWKFKSGLGILLGGGVQHLNRVTAMSGTTSITIGGLTAANLEFGIRYMLF